MKSFFLFWVSMISFATVYAQKPDTARIGYKQRFLNSFTLQREILNLKAGDIVHEGDTVFLSLLPFMTTARLSSILSFDTIWVKTRDGQKYGYSRRILNFSEKNIVPIIDTATGLKKMGSWKYLNEDEYFFPILEKVLKNGKCSFPDQITVPSKLGITKEEFQKFIDEPLYFPDSLSEKMRMTLEYYNPVFFKKRGF